MTTHSRLLLAVLVTCELQLSLERGVKPRIRIEWAVPPPALSSGRAIVRRRRLLGRGRRRVLGAGAIRARVAFAPGHGGCGIWGAEEVIISLRRDLMAALLCFRLVVYSLVLFGRFYYNPGRGMTAGTMRPRQYLVRK